MKLKERLHRYRWIVKTVDELEDRLLEIDTKLEKVTSRLTHDKVQTPMQADKWGDLISLKVDIQNNINERILESYAEMRYIENLFDSLPDRERLMMIYKYIDGLTWEEVAVKMNYTWVHMHRLHANCLIELERVIEC